VKRLLLVLVLTIVLTSCQDIVDSEPGLPATEWEQLTAVSDNYATVRIDGHYCIVASVGITCDFSGAVDR
jgi:hypothetical protein